MEIPIDQLQWAIAEWVIPTVIAALSTGAQLYGQKRQRDAQREAMREAERRQNQRLLLEAGAASDAHQKRMAALATQAHLANQRSDQFQFDVNDQLGNIDQDLEKTENRRRKSLDQALKRDPAGEAGGRRQVGSEVKGRISESFAERGAKAGAENEASANRYADRLAVLGSFRELPQQRNRQMNTIGLNQLPHQRRASSQAAIDRLRIGQASLVPPESNEYIDTSDPFGDLLVGLGQGGMYLYGMGAGGKQGPYSTTGGGGAPGTNMTKRS